MPGQGTILKAALCCISLGACGDDARQAPAAGSGAAPPPTRGEVASGPTTRVRIHPSLPEFEFTLIGDTTGGPGASIRVERIEIRRDSAVEPDQVIGSLATDTPMTAEVPALEVLDMNFDGYKDIRLVEFRSAGPNTAYLHWLFDPPSGRFLESPGLNDIPSAHFDAVRREIRSDWRDGAARHGSSIYVFAEGQPVLVRQEEKTYQAPGTYLFEVKRLVDGVWRTVEQRQVSEQPPEADARAPGASR
jgi:hypothetical protein